ncbi:RES family NAD+ phosphorylase [Parapontixanthobacter aurantiacus]|uniref:RES family NAD+ phosphorylase n=1 Tax=Parapontixanthobacter aurantiacus TaxID=1463599 RepID=UPI000C93EE3F|nr:hypothetical protein [Erythrobacter sp.]
MSESGLNADWQLSNGNVILADMRLWRLTRLGHQTLDGKGAELSGGRYSSPGLPVVSLASEAGAAVLIALRYWLDRLDEAPNDLTLGWTNIDSRPERAPDGLAEGEIKTLVDDWIVNRNSLLLAVRSKVLPEADVVLLNPAHEDARSVSPLQTRPFRFDECLHRPPMLDAFRERRGSD